MSCPYPICLCSNNMHNLGGRKSRDSLALAQWEPVWRRVRVLESKSLFDLFANGRCING